MKRTALALAILTAAITASSTTTFANTASARPKTTVRPKAKPKRTTTTRPRVTTTTTTRVTTTTINPATPEAVLAAYQRFADVRYALFVDPAKYQTELPKVASGQALTYWKGFFAASIKEDLYWTGKRDEFKAIDLRVQSVNASEAIVRVCEYQSSAPSVHKDGSVVPDSTKPFITDLRITFRYSKSTGWLAVANPILEDVEGESKCADGKV